MSLWQEAKGSRLEALDGSLVFFDRQANPVPYGRVLIDASPVDSSAQLAALLCTEPAGAVVPFFVRLRWGSPGPLCELVTVGASQLLVLFSPAPQHWYAREFSRVLLVSTSRGESLVRRLQAETGSNLLQVQSPMNGCWVHYADLEGSVQAAGAWHGRTFAAQDQFTAHPSDFSTRTCPSFQAAAQALGAWIVDRMRGGHPVVEAVVLEDLAMDRASFAALDEALGPRSTKRRAKDQLKRKGLR